MGQVDSVLVLLLESNILGRDFRQVVPDMNKRDFVMNRTQHQARKDLVHMDFSAQHILVLCLVIQYSRGDMYTWRNRYPITYIELSK